MFKIELFILVFLLNVIHQDTNCCVLLNSSSLISVVKDIIVLSHEFTFHDPEKLILHQQKHLKAVTAPYKYLRKASTNEMHP